MDFIPWIKHPNIRRQYYREISINQYQNIGKEFTIFFLIICKDIVLQLLHLEGSQVTKDTSLKAPSDSDYTSGKSAVFRGGADHLDSSDRGGIKDSCSHTRLQLVHH